MEERRCHCLFDLPLLGKLSNVGLHALVDVQDIQIALSNGLKFGRISCGTGLPVCNQGLSPSYPFISGDIIYA